MMNKWEYKIIPNDDGESALTLSQIQEIFHKMGEDGFEYSGKVRYSDPKWMNGITGFVFRKCQQS